jgi:hypothetical protein
MRAPTIEQEVVTLCGILDMLFLKIFGGLRRVYWGLSDG